MDYEGVKLKLTDSRIDVREVRATLDEATWKRILIEEVARQAEIMLGQPGVTTRAYLSTVDTSTGFRHEIKVEVTEDYAGRPRSDHA